jgi:hypothetical protein
MPAFLSGCGLEGLAPIMTLKGLIIKTCRKRVLAVETPLTTEISRLIIAHF